MRITFMLLLIFVFLGGCATAKKIHTSDGTEGYSITCSGRSNNWGMCYEKAAEICGSRGYEILEKSDDKGVAVSGNQFGLYGGSVINRNMIIK